MRQVSGGYIQHVSGGIIQDFFLARPHVEASLWDTLIKAIMQIYPWLHFTSGSYIRQVSDDYFPQISGSYILDFFG